MVEQAVFRPLIDGVSSRTNYVPVDLSKSNPNISAELVQDPERCATFLEEYCQERAALVAYGGYMENRDLYTQNGLFQRGETRSLHLGVDFWCAADNHILAPFSGRIHSFANNTVSGDYGPTLILEHRTEWSETPFEGFSLYGHLAEESLANWIVGQEVKAGEVIAKLGEAHENGGYAPHLHFQLILEMQDEKGDYPGVCAPSDQRRFAANCPDPLPFLGLSAP